MSFFRNKRTISTKDFHSAIENLLSCAADSRIESITPEDAWFPHTEYKIDAMPHTDSDTQTIPLKHKTSLLSPKKKKETITCLKFYMNRDVSSPEIVLIATVKGSGKRVVRFKPLNRDIDSELNALCPYAKIYETFQRPTAVPFQWQNPDEYERIYSGKTIITSYKEIYQLLEDNVMAFIQKLHEKSDHAHAIKLNLIEGGCGRSILLQQLCEIIAKKFNDEINLKAFGFELAQHNVEKLQEKNPDGHYIEGDVTKSDAAFRTATEKKWLHQTEAKELHEEPYTLMVCSGVLTRGVLNVAQTVRALQSIYHSGVSALICAGFNEATFNAHLAKNIGMRLVIQQHGTFPVYLLERISPKEICDKKNIAFAKEKTAKLDLSLCSVPLYVLQHLDDKLKPSVEVLDLSFCRPEDIDHDELKKLLKDYPNLHTVIFYQPSEEDLTSFKTIQLSDSIQCKTGVAVKTFEHSYKDTLDQQRTRTESYCHDVHFMSEKMWRLAFGVEKASSLGVSTNLFNPTKTFNPLDPGIIPSNEINAFKNDLEQFSRAEQKLNPITVTAISAILNKIDQIQNKTSTKVSESDLDHIHLHHKHTLYHGELKELILKHRKAFDWILEYQPPSNTDKCKLS